VVKVEYQHNEEKGMIALAFECSTEEEQEIVDAIRTTIMGPHEKQGGYINSNRWVVHVKTQLPTEEKA
jgi:hypothetical protein